jgi:hypothetical protein
MPVFKVSRSHISAQELGTSTPFIPKPLYVTADRFSYGENAVTFFDQRGGCVYAIRKDRVVEIALNDEQVVVER